MKTLNSKSGSFVPAAVSLASGNEDRQPCWYADIERSDKRKDCKWKVGCKNDGQTDEYSFKISKAGDVDDNDFWSRATGLDFATELIDLFKNGGQQSVKRWIKNGCP